MIIKDKISEGNKFSFTEVSQSKIEKGKGNKERKCQKSYNSQKYTTKSVKNWCNGYCRNIKTTFQPSTGKFPNNLKNADVTPMFGKKNPLNKENYRSVSVLPIISKVFEKLMQNQIFYT